MIDNLKNLEPANLSSRRLYEILKQKHLIKNDSILIKVENELNLRCSDTAQTQWCVPH